MKVLACFLFILAFGLDNTIQFDASTRAQTAGTEVIQGVVVSLPGTPVPKAWVYAENRDNIREKITGITDENGRFTLNVHPGNWFVHAYKEEAGYPDCRLWFSGAISQKAWRVVDIQPGQPVNIAFELGPKFASVELLIHDEKGAPTGGGMGFTWRGVLGTDEQRTTRTGHDISGFKRYLIPPDVPFKIRIEKEGYETWHSKVQTGGEWMRLKSGEVVSMTAKLKKVSSGR